MRNIFGQDNLQNFLSARYDDEVHTLCYYNHIINGGVVTSNVCANYFSKLLSDKKVENYILNVSDDYSDSSHIVAYKLYGKWYGITCYNSRYSINSEKISDLNTCLKNVFRLYSSSIYVSVDVSKCQYFRNLNISEFTEYEMDNYEKDGICVEIPRKLINSGSWDFITYGLMEKITQCHNPEYLRTIHPIYNMIYNLLNY